MTRKNRFKANWHELPSQTDIMLPLLETLDAAGGWAKPGTIYDCIAEKLGLSDEVRNATTTRENNRNVNTYERRVRWTRQTAVAKGLIDNRERNRWALTDRAHAKLGNIVRGKIVTIFTTHNGLMLWANAEDAIGLIERESISLILTSPPYALCRPREYGNRQGSQWVDWLVRLCEGWRGLLTPTGSMMLNIGPTWTPNAPRQTLNIERLLIKLEDALGIYLLQRLDWHSPTKLPTPLEYVGKQRIRVKSSVEAVLWLSPYPHAAKADNRRVLQPYSKSGRAAIAKTQSSQNTRPCGITFGKNSFIDNGGAIPNSLIVAPNGGTTAYHQATRAAEREPHPAIMPEAIAEFGIALTTTPGDDIVYDPLAGSGTTAAVAERLGRKWICSERSLEYIRGAELRLRTQNTTITDCFAA